MLRKRSQERRAIDDALIPVKVARARRGRIRLEIDDAIAERESTLYIDHLRRHHARADDEVIRRSDGVDWALAPRWTA